jgi:hypothetical protein
MVRLEELGQLEKFNDLIGTRTQDLPACSIANQPSTLPVPHEQINKSFIIYASNQRRLSIHTLKLLSRTIYM